MQRQERRLLQKEENLDRKIDSFEKKEEHLALKETKLNESQAKVDELYQKQLGELERLSGLSTEDAKKELLLSVEEEVKHESAMMIKELEQQAKDEADRKAREIISLAIQRCAADHVAETTVSVVALPNDEMKRPHYRPRGQKHQNSGNTDRHRSYYRRYSGSGYYFGV